MVSSRTAGKRLSPFGHALAGSGGAVLALLLTFPLDLIKTRLQVQTRDTVYSTDYRSVGDAVRRIVREEGWLGLYAGLPSALLGVASTNFAYFYWYSFIRGTYQRKLAERAAANVHGAAEIARIGTAMELLLGYTVLRELSSNYSYYLRTLYNQPHSALAAALAQLFTIPVAVITTRQQTHVDIAKDDSIAKPTNDVDELQLLPSEVFKKKKAAKIEQHTTVQPAASTIAGRKRLSMRQALDLIVAEDGWTGLWRGLKPSLVLCVNPAITYGLFERVKTALIARQAANGGGAEGASVELASLSLFYLGLLSKTLATVITYPYIIAKVRMQWRPADHKTNERVQYKGAVDVLRRIYRAEGLSGWYKGMPAQISKAVLTQAMLFVIKDKLTLYTYMLFVLLKHGTLSGRPKRV